MSDGSEFQVCGAATENARRANSVRVLAADSMPAPHHSFFYMPDAFPGAQQTVSKH